VRAIFACFGQIDNVRIIRDKATGLGKGFGYVQFTNASSVDAAVQAARSGTLPEHGASAAAASPKPSRRGKYRTAASAQVPGSAKDKGSSGLVLRIGSKTYPLRVMPSMKKTELVRFQRQRSFVKRGGSKVPFPSLAHLPLPTSDVPHPELPYLPRRCLSFTRSPAPCPLPPAPCPFPAATLAGSGKAHETLEESQAAT
jgi:RNA recognition motif-containing protein